MVATVACAALIIGFQQKPYFKTVNAKSEIPSLTLAVSTLKNDYLQIEPIPLSITLSNRTNQPIPWKGILIIGPNVNLLTRNAGGEEFKFVGSKYATGLFGSASRTMQSGEQVQQNVLLDRALSELLFPHPGHYDLQVEFVYGTGAEGKQQIKIVSNSISIDISEPQGLERQAYEYIKGPLTLAEKQTDVQVIAQRKQEFVDRYRNSVYAKYISFRLAFTYKVLGEDEKALRELCKISNENFYYSKDVQRDVYQIEEKLRPFVMLPLPENVPTPIRPHPCLRLQN